MGVPIITARLSDVCPAGESQNNVKLPLRVWSAIGRRCRPAFFCGVSVTSIGADSNYRGAGEAPRKITSRIDGVGVSRLSWCRSAERSARDWEGSTKSRSLVGLECHRYWRRGQRVGSARYPEFDTALHFDQKLGQLSPSSRHRISRSWVPENRLGLCVLHGSNSNVLSGSGRYSEPLGLAPRSARIQSEFESSAARRFDALSSLISAASQLAGIWDRL